MYYIFSFFRALAWTTLARAERGSEIEGIVFSLLSRAANDHQNTVRRAQQPEPGLQDALLAHGLAAPGQGRPLRPAQREGRLRGRVHCQHRRSRIQGDPGEGKVAMHANGAQVKNIK